MERVGPGRLAWLDQASAHFRALTEDLLKLHDEAAILTVEENDLDPAAVQARIEEISKEIYDKLVTPFMRLADDQASVFSFAMFLIDTISVMRRRENLVANTITEQMNGLSVLAARLGIRLEVDRGAPL